MAKQVASIAQLVHCACRLPNASSAIVKRSVRIMVRVKRSWRMKIYFVYFVPATVELNV
mgnify:CR=1 FL=1